MESSAEKLSAEEVTAAECLAAEGLGMEVLDEEVQKTSSRRNQKTCTCMASADTLSGFMVTKQHYYNKS
ncbi:hypothetical protein PF010_g12511 [Phytophthora fragariae]|uniref:Uncharacterized protein n=1 Tax=Phytophthora fragariae TaxID=53985 RepID=A0A6G0L3F9_9STRA|nr:hypothetical protein PF010_g12511 [Phytophthora fragariae]